jgi:hypothetical protein
VEMAAQCMQGRVLSELDSNTSVKSRSVASYELATTFFRDFSPQLSTIYTLTTHTHVPTTLIETSIKQTHANTHSFSDKTLTLTRTSHLCARNPVALRLRLDVVQLGLCGRTPRPRSHTAVHTQVAQREGRGPPTLNFRVVVERRTVMHNRAHFRESVWLLLRSFASPFTSSCICLITLASFSFPRLNTCASLHVLEQARFDSERSIEETHHAVPAHRP